MIGLRRLAEIVRRHPRQIALAGVATGIALAPLSLGVALAAAGLLCAALSGAAGGRIGLLACGALLAGALVGDARLAAIDAAGSELDAGDRVRGRAILCSRPRAPGPSAPAPRCG